MAHKEVLLLKPVEGLGSEGDQVKVRAGYARNYLLPRKVAVELNQANRRRIEALRRVRAEREAKELEGARKIADQIQTLSIAIAVKTGEGGRMFGAVTAQDVLDKLAAAGISLDKRRVHLAHPVRTLGKHEISIRLHSEVKFEMPFEVVSENPIVSEPAAPATEAPGEEQVSVRKPRRSRSVEKAG